MSIFENFNEITINFSHTLGTSIFNEEGQKIGKLNDFFVDYEEVFPSVLAIQYKRNGQLFYISWKDIITFSYKRIIINNSSFIGRSRTYPKANQNKVVTTSLLANQLSGETVEYPTLGKIVLDRQIVDTFGKKVVRVNDVQFIRSGQDLRVTHAAIGIRSMLRRLGYERLIDSVFKIFNPKSKYLTTEKLINWKYVHAIPSKNIHASVQLNLTNDDIKGIHPADLADILEDLDNHGREIVFSSLDPKTAADTLSEVEEEFIRPLLKNEDAERVADIIEEMDTDDAADLLNEMTEARQVEIISKIDDEEVKEEVQELLEHDDDTAGGLMTTDVFTVGPESRKSEILATIKEKYEELETIYDIYVVEENEKLIGHLTLHDVLTIDEDLKAKDLMKTEDIKKALPYTHWKRVASLMSKYNLMNLPIVDENEELLGIVSVDDVLPWLLGE